ncbi:MAG: hypothetical protein AAFQ80_17645 [Cyanobacteria bacterium J06621_8]
MKIDLLDIAGKRLEALSNSIIDLLTPLPSNTEEEREPSDRSHEIGLHDIIPRLDSGDRKAKSSDDKPIRERRIEYPYFVPFVLLGLLLVFIFSGYIFEILAFGIDLYYFAAFVLEEYAYYGIATEAVWLIAIGFILLVAAGLIYGLVRLLSYPLARQISWILLSIVTVLSLPLTIWLSNIFGTTIPLWLFTPVIYGVTLGVGIINYLPPVLDIVWAIGFLIGIPIAQVTFPNTINRMVEQYGFFADETIKPFLSGITYEEHEIRMTVYIFLGLLILIGFERFLRLLSNIQSERKT